MRYKKVKVGERLTRGKLSDRMVRINRVSNFYLMLVLNREVPTRPDVVMQAFNIAERRGLL